MGVTPSRGLPYPEGTDDPDVPDDVQQLALALDKAVLYASGLLSARPAGAEGDVYWATDGGEDGNGGLYYKHSTAWVLAGPKTVVAEADIQNSAVTANKIGTNAVTTAKILDGNVTKAKLEGPIKPSGSAGPGDEALRAIGATGDTVVAGNDSRLSAGAAGSATVRSLGSGSTQAAPGNDIRITSPFGAVRQAVRAVERSNINTSSAPSTINGISPTSGDNFLLVGQSAATENGVWTWNGAASAMTRRTDFDETSELMRGTLILAIDGAAGIDAGTYWMLTPTGTLTLGSSNLTWQAVGYQGYGATGSKPAATLVASGGQYLDTTTGAVFYSTGSAWTKFSQFPSGSLLPYGGASAPSFFLLAYGQSVSTTTYADLFAVIGYSFGGAGGSFNVPDLRGRAAVGLDNLGGASANRLTAAAADTMGGSGGVETHALSTGELAQHSHTGTTAAVSAGTPAGTISSAGVHNHTTFATQVHRAALSGASLSSSGSVVNTGSVGSTYTPGTTSDGSHNHAFTGSALGTHSHTFTSDNTGSGTAHENTQPWLATSWIIKT